MDASSSCTSSSPSKDEPDVVDKKSTSAGSVSHNGTATGGSDSEDMREAIKAKLSSKSEKRRVAALRYLVLAILVGSAAAICTVVYKMSSNAESQDYETTYEGISVKILNSFGRVKEHIGVINGIGLAMTSHGLFLEQMNLTSWPYVTLPDFHQRGETIRSLTGALYVSVAPVVSDDERYDWEKYVVSAGADWIGKGLAYQSGLGYIGYEHNPPSVETVLMQNLTRKPIFTKDENVTANVEYLTGPYVPKWQTSPVLLKDDVNGDMLRTSSRSKLVSHCVREGKVTLDGFLWGPPGNSDHENTTTALLSTLRSFKWKRQEPYFGAPVMYTHIPIFHSFDDSNKKVSGVLETMMLWRDYFVDILPESQRGITVVVENTCNGFFTYEINGTQPIVLGPGDLHDRKYDEYGRIAVFETADGKILDGSKNGMEIDEDSCEYSLHVYPTQEFSDSIKTNTPFLLTFTVACVFLFVILLFIFYNYVVERRQQIILNKAVQSTAVVSSMFPKQVRDRLLAVDDDKKDTKKSSMSAFLDNGASTSKQQIADLFPHCTVMFADISGFTAWSSTRGPEHVFVLLQTLYHGFDQIAKRRKVFKVETIGDCYLAVTGLPDPQPKHALIMARFAYECKLKMTDMTRELEISLGPDCSDLKMRFGLNSGPVTAGVLRGERARFQLFGDTVNTAARMESTGIKDKIQISQTTADLLISEDKLHWIEPRMEEVDVKGKGNMKTYWLNPGRTKKAKSRSGSSASGSLSSDDPTTGSSSMGGQLHPIDDNLVKKQRLVNWMVEILMEHVRNMILKTKTLHRENEHVKVPTREPGTICLDEVLEVIPISKFESFHNKSTNEIESDEKIHESVFKDLREYVSLIANMYHDNPFHSFDHACHVTMSVSKLLKRIVSVTPDDNGNDENESEYLLHLRTYGISSDPVAQFAIVFSAMIHDVDHRGCSNAQLVKEQEQMGKLYRNQSVAEQNSLDLAWGLLMSSQFDQLRKELFVGDDLCHFRQIIVNNVLATDIFDKELNDLRRARWERAFSAEGEADANQLDRKGTIVIEHIIQASDVAHTMQHWHVYRKWNLKLFTEMYAAFLDGRMAVDPSTFWYKGEISFFDNYVIPLAKKLKDCNVFGVSSDEYLNYAVGNRAEWERCGQALLEEYLQEMPSITNRT